MRGEVFGQKAKFGTRAGQSSPSAEASSKRCFFIFGQNIRSKPHQMLSVATFFMVYHDMGVKALSEAPYPILFWAQMQWKSGLPSSNTYISYI